MKKRLLHLVFGLLLAGLSVEAMAQTRFRVSRVSPGDGATNVDRKTPWVTVTFEGETIDCARTGRGKSAFHLRSVSPGIVDAQSMYENPTAPTARDKYYRGHLRCEENTNRLTFSTPGVLLGASKFQVEINAWSKTGKSLSHISEFTTKNPGLSVHVLELENHYGGDKTCDTYWNGSDYCDIYVTWAVAMANLEHVGRMPTDSSDYGNMRWYKQDPTGGRRQFRPGIALFASDVPVQERLMIQAWAHDKDETSRWKQVLASAGQVAKDAAPALATINPVASGYTVIGSGVLKGIAESIPSGEDEFLGSASILLELAGRWGTRSGAFNVDLQPRGPGRGPIRLQLVVDELPRSWRLAQAID